MKKFQSILRSIALLAMMAFAFTSCVKEEYDEPVTANVDPNLTVTTSLGELRSMAVGTAPIAITTDIIIAGIVTADDESGNFYKEMIIQDSTGAISVLLDISNYNSNYPIGRRIYIKCNGLYIASDADGNVQLGAVNLNTIGRIPAGVVQQYLYPGQWGLAMPYVDATLASINNSLSSYTQKLVRIQPVEFEQADAGTAWGGDPTSTFDNNRTLKDCGSNTLIVYTSSYANFVNQFTPTGNGTIAGILKIYRGAGELVIRNPTDAESMTGTRCDSLNLNPTPMSIDSLRQEFTGTTTTCPLGRSITGIVISDYVNGNLDGKNVVIQDGNSGIVVRFTASHTFQVGDQVKVNISGQELSEYRGWLQVNNVPLGNAIKVGTGTVTPRICTIAAMLANYDAWESTLINIQGVTISGGTTPGLYSGSTTLTDATGTLTMYTRSAAVFSGSSYPTTAVSVTGILSEYTNPTFTPQLLIRSTSDVQ